MGLQHGWITECVVASVAEKRVCSHLPVCHFQELEQVQKPQRFIDGSWNQTQQPEVMICLMLLNKSSEKPDLLT